jgi:hypothetical protein
MDEETNDIIARLYLSEKNMSRVEAKEFAAWATLQIERGHDTDGLRRLSEQSAADDDPAVEQLFRDCVAEIGWEIPSRKHAMKRHSEATLRRIVNGEIEPYDGCSHLYIISIYLGHPGYLYSWNEMFWAREELGVEKLNKLITRAARRALGEEPDEIYPDDDLLDEEDDDDERPRNFWNQLKGLLGWR